MKCNPVILAGDIPPHMVNNKFFLSLIVMLLCIHSANGQLGYGGELGLGMSSMRFAPAIGFTKASKQPAFSCKAGALLDAGITQHLYFQAGLYASLKGHSRSFSFYHSDSLNEAVTQKLRLCYFDMPLNLCYKTAMQGKGRIIIGIGCTPSYILGGSNKIRSYGSDSGIAFNTTLNPSVTNKYPFKAFDLGVNLFAGYELPTGLFFRAYYTAGTNDLGLGTEIDKHRIWGIAAGYLFGKDRNINKEADDLIDKSVE